MIVQMTGVVSDEGSLVVLEGFELNERGEQGAVVKFAAEWRYAIDLAAAVEEGEEAICEIEDWQIIGKVEA